MSENTKRIEELRKELAGNPGSRQFYQLGELLRRDGRASEAVPVLRGGLARNPRYVAAWVALGRSCMEAGQHLESEAASALTEALTLDPQNPVAWRLLGEAKLAMGDRLAALEAMQRAIALVPTDEVLRAAVESLAAEPSHVEPPVPSGAGEPARDTEIASTSAVEVEGLGAVIHVAEGSFEPEEIWQGPEAAPSPAPAQGAAPAGEAVGGFGEFAVPPVTEGAAPAGPETREPMLVEDAAPLEAPPDFEEEMSLAGQPGEGLGAAAEETAAFGGEAPLAAAAGEVVEPEPGGGDVFGDVFGEAPEVGFGAVGAAQPAPLAEPLQAGSVEEAGLPVSVADAPAVAAGDWVEGHAPEDAALREESSGFGASPEPEVSALGQAAAVTEAVAPVPEPAYAVAEPVAPVPVPAYAAPELVPLVPAAPPAFPEEVPEIAGPAFSEPDEAPVVPEEVASEGADVPSSREPVQELASPAAGVFASPEEELPPAWEQGAAAPSAPLEPPATLTLARLYLHQQELGAAVGVLEQLLQREPSNTEAKDLLELVRDMMSGAPEPLPPLPLGERKIAALQRWLAGFALARERVKQ